MVLVRKTELGCRNNWDQDLWELAPELAGDVSESDIHIPDPQHAPLTADGSLASASSRHGDMFTDKLTSITVAPPRTSSSTVSGGNDDDDSHIERSDVRAARQRRVEQLERERHVQRRERADEARKLLEPEPQTRPQPKPETTTRPQKGEVKQEARHAPERRPATVRSDQNQRAAPQPERLARPEMPVAPRPARPAQPRLTYPDVAGDVSISFGASPGSFDRKAQPQEWSPRPARQQPQERSRATVESRPPIVQQETDDLPTNEVRALQAGAQERRNPRAQQPTESAAQHEHRVTRKPPESQIEPPVEERDPGWMLWAGQIDGPRTPQDQ